MSIKRINEFPEGSGSLSNDDLFVFMDDSSGSGVTKKITLSQLSASIGGGSSGSGNFSTLLVNGTGVSISGHTHTASNITDFNSSISGLLPVKSIVGSGNISVTSVSGNFTIGSSGLVKSDITGITAASGINNMVRISQANYDALVTKDSSTLYVIT